VFIREQVQTLAEVHQTPDDSDSGHSSSYAPGTSPTDNGGYLVPKAYEAAADSGTSSSSSSKAGGSSSTKQESGGVGGRRRKRVAGKGGELVEEEQQRLVDQRDGEEGKGVGEEEEEDMRDSVFSPDYQLDSYPPPNYEQAVDKNWQRNHVPV
jgi:hypothetical protein